jgi:hypothetical protein
VYGPCDLGPLRTLEKTGEIQGLHPKTVEELSAKWNWVARCDQWDAHVSACADKAFLEEVAKRSRQRGAAFSALLGKSLQALQRLDLEKASLAQIATAIKVATVGMRLEDGLETSRVVVQSIPIREVVVELPAYRHDLPEGSSDWDTAALVPEHSLQPFSRNL